MRWQKIPAGKKYQLAKNISWKKYQLAKKTSAGKKISVGKKYQLAKNISAGKKYQPANSCHVSLAITDSSSVGTTHTFKVNIYHPECF